MNKQRREAISALHSKLDDLKSEIEAVLGEEQDAYDNLPDSLRTGEKGDKMYEAIEALESAVSSIEDALSSLDDATQE